MSYAERDFAIVPAAAPAWKNQRTTSCPAPISAKVPYLGSSRLTLRALRFVVNSSVDSMASPGNGQTYLIRRKKSSFVQPEESRHGVAFKGGTRRHACRRPCSSATPGAWIPDSYSSTHRNPEVSWASEAHPQRPPMTSHDQLHQS